MRLNCLGIETKMSKFTYPRSWSCPTCGKIWRFNQDGRPEEVMCICDVDELFRELGMVDEEPEGAGSPYKRAQCPFCGRWHRLPQNALLPPECNCPQVRKQRVHHHVGEPDPFRRFIEDELDLD